VTFSIIEAVFLDGIRSLMIVFSRINHLLFLLPLTLIRVTEATTHVTGSQQEAHSSLSLWPFEVGFDHNNI
jgi:hypothetical protein